MTKHTPGPWRAEPHNANDWRVVSDDYGTIVFRTCYPDPDVDCSVEADARLIAAAPELLTACKKLLEVCDAEPECRVYKTFRDDARAAIAKATGQT